MIWTLEAMDAEARGDWTEAKRCWYYAAQEARKYCQGDLAARYGDREDAAEHKRLEHIKRAAPHL